MCTLCCLSLRYDAVCARESVATIASSAGSVVAVPALAQVTDFSADSVGVVEPEGALGTGKTVGRVLSASLNLFNSYIYISLVCCRLNCC